MKLRQKMSNPTIFKPDSDLMKIYKSYEEEYKSFIRKPMEIEEIKKIFYSYQLLPQAPYPVTEAKK